MKEEFNVNCSEETIVPGFEEYTLIGTAIGNKNKASLLLEQSLNNELKFVFVPLEALINTDSIMSKYDSSYEKDVLVFTLDMKQFDERIESFKDVLVKIKDDVAMGNNHVSKMGVGIFAYTLTHLSLSPNIFNLEYTPGFKIKCENQGHTKNIYISENNNKLPQIMIDRILIKVFERTVNKFKKLDFCNENA